MAATNFTPISLYYSETPSAQPTNTNLVKGELAINIYDGKLYYKDNTNTVQLLASKETSSNVTSVSLVSTNGFSGSVANPTTTPAITLSTSVSGVLKGSGGALIAASPGVDYAPATTGSSILYADGSGGFSAVTIGSNLTFTGGTLSATGGSSSGVTSFNTRTGAVTLASTDVVGALGYTPAQANGGNASGTWGINISGNAATATTATSATSATTATTATNSTQLGGVAASGYVATTGTQTVAGLKTFSSSITASAGIAFNGTATGIDRSAWNLYNASRGNGTYNSIFIQTSGTALNQQDYVFAFNNNNTSASFAYVFNGAGTATAANWSSTSDARIKENVVTLQSGLDKLTQLRPVEFSYKRDKLSAPDHYGLIAQELAEVLPNIVDDSSLNDGDVQNIKSVSYTELIPILIKAVQELKAEVDALKAAK